MKVLALIHLFSVTTSLGALSQRVIHGQVKDAETRASMSSVHIRTAHEGLYSDGEGLFTLTVATADTLVFSHVGYTPSTVEASALSTDSLLVWLTPHEMLLQEVVVRDRVTEERLRREILRARCLPSKEETHAISNVANARHLYLTGYVPPMNSQDNYQWQQQKPVGVTLFSSGPTKGIGKALRQLSHSRGSSQTPPMHPPLPVTTPPLRRTGPVLPAIDTLRTVGPQADRHP